MLVMGVEDSVFIGVIKQGLCSLYLLLYLLCKCGAIFFRYYWYYGTMYLCVYVFTVYWFLGSIGSIEWYLC